MYIRFGVRTHRNITASLNKKFSSQITQITICYKDMRRAITLRSATTKVVAEKLNYVELIVSDVAKS